MKKNVIILVVLLALALVPVSCTLFFSGEEPVPSDMEEQIDSRDSTVPVFVSFENKRYQQHDRLISKYVADYNANRAKWAGATPEQAGQMPNLTVEQVKAHMIQETGGGDVRSRAAWAKDPLQVNVPGDWNPYKKHLGLRQPRKRNEGSLETNLKAGIMLLARKGYGVSGQPAANNRKNKFDNWRTALQRYNGRSDRAADGRPYREVYAERILQRAKSGTQREVEIPIRTKRK